MKFTAKNILCEESFSFDNEPRNAALFTVGNGYMGVRGSFEEFGSLRIQGCYVRGFSDNIIEVMEPFCDNEYMKKYYFNEDGLKDFEYQESCINLPDVLFARIEVDGVSFSTTEGKILEWKRYLDSEKAVLTRQVLWDNGKGDITSLKFERFASFSNDHLLCQKITVCAKNHNKKIKIFSGIDKRVKTGGQKVTTSLYESVNDSKVMLAVSGGKKYGFSAKMFCASKFFEGGKEKQSETFCGKENVLDVCCEFSGEKEIVLEKFTLIAIDRDPDVDFANFFVDQDRDFDYKKEYEEHISKYSIEFKKADIKIEGDFEADAALRFSVYHTLISAARNDSIHGISAKGLTGERYNMFVWWDCEIYQLPFFIHNFPQTAKNTLLYRYKMLEGARQNAKISGQKGAKFAFCSSVSGDERVWIYARHPHLQIHINCDVAYGIINYCDITGDEQFLFDSGMEMLLEIAMYFTTRATFENGKYHIKNVTGTDEHHPYVNDDAYTNYLLSYVLSRTLEYLNENDFSSLLEKLLITQEDIAKITDIKEKIYLPLDENGLIEQFEGYFSLSRSLEIQGAGSGKNFQMKQSGLYHKSQIIKQPDVMLLYSYLNFDIPGSDFDLNWNYYEKMCETSSSLSFPVHAICNADAKRMLSFHTDFMKTVRMDIDDIHNCAWQGVHSGCAAGGWYAVFRGIAGIKCKKDDCIEINPAFMPWWKKISFSFLYKNTRINVIIEGRKMTLSIEEGKGIDIIFKEERKKLIDSLSIEF